ncbi:hypothetical protein BVG19_g263 [[Candida] boidinii]|nr:hypothetical protein BVG19_g263 [[Candida] boidinii]OWB49752.1 hypothetical protein B5S27_g1296 [[Candida] boidinii]
MSNVDVSLLISKESIILKEIIETLGSIDKKLYISQKEFFTFLNSKISNNSIDNPIHVSILDTQKLFKLGKNLSSNINHLKSSNYKGNEPALKKNLVDIITKTLIVLTSSVFINNIANERENSKNNHNNKKDNSLISDTKISPNSVNNNYHSSMPSNASRLSSLNSLNSNITSSTATTAAANSPFNNNVKLTANSLSALTIQNIYNNGPNHSNIHNTHNTPLNPHSQFNSSHEQQIKTQQHHRPTNDHLNMITKPSSSSSSGSSDLTTTSSASNTSNFTTYNNYNINTNGTPLDSNTTATTNTIASPNRHVSKASISTNNSTNSVKILTSVNKGYGIYQPDNRLILRNVLYQLYSLLNLIESSIREHFNESLTTGIFPNLLHNLIILVNASIISKLIKILQISSKSKFKFQSEDLFKSIK